MYACMYVCVCYICTYYRIVQGRDQSISIRLFYTVQGPEEGRNLELTFPNFPTNVFTSVNVISIVSFKIDAATNLHVVIRPLFNVVI